VTRYEKTCTAMWVLTYVVAGALVLFLTRCGGSAVARQDSELSKNFAVCDTEAKAIAHTAPDCLTAIRQLITLMGRPECADFAHQGAEAQPDSITIGGVTYVCEGVPGGR
jgi:hypothetical protein